MRGPQQVGLRQTPAAVLGGLDPDLEEVSSLGHDQVIPRFVGSGLHHYVKSAAGKLGGGDAGGTYGHWPGRGLYRRGDLKGHDSLLGMGGWGTEGLAFDLSTPGGTLERDALPEPQG